MVEELYVYDGCVVREKQQKGKASLYTEMINREEGIHLTSHLLALLIMKIKNPHLSRKIRNLRPWPHTRNTYHIEKG